MTNKKITNKVGKFPRIGDAQVFLDDDHVREPIEKEARQPHCQKGEGC